MTSTTSLNKTKTPFLSMMLWNLKKALPVTVVYSFLLFVVFPLTTVISKNIYRHYDFVNYNMVNSFATFVITAFSIIIGLMMFSIYHNKRSVDLYASLPIKKHTLFLAKYFSGLMVLIVPLIVFMIINLFAGSQIYSTSIFVTFYNLIGYIISIINIYSMIALFAMACGGTADTIVSFAVVNVGVLICAYFGMLLMSSILPSDQLYGVSYDIIHTTFLILCPISMPYLISSVDVVAYKNKEVMSSFIDTEVLTSIAIYMAIWLLLAVVYFVAALMISKKRRNENVQNGFIYSFPKIVIQAIASVTAGLILGWGFLDAFATIIAFMIGALLGSFAGCFAVTLIYNKGLKRMEKSLPVFVCSFVALAGFFLVLLVLC